MKYQAVTIFVQLSVPHNMQNIGQPINARGEFCAVLRNRLVSSIGVQRGKSLGHYTVDNNREGVNDDTSTKSDCVNRVRARVLLFRDRTFAHLS